MRRIAYRTFAIVVSAAVLSAGLGRRPGAAVMAVQQPLDRHASENCGAAKDLVVRALEEMDPKSTPGQLEDAIQLLKRAASDLCSESGDAWYYRGLVETQLKHDAKVKFTSDQHDAKAKLAYALHEANANFAYKQAAFFHSMAQLEGIDPFVLATPDARGVIKMEVAKGDARKLAITIEKTTPAQETLPSKTERAPEKWALVIGISQFHDQDIPHLQYTTRDADGFATALKDSSIGQFKPDHVRELTDVEAKGKNIKEELNWIARQAGPNDLVVVYVATHGSPRSMDSVAGVNYLVTYDTEMFRDGRLDEDAMYATAFPMVELATAISTRMKSLRTLVVLDTCYSGGSFTAQSTPAKVVAKSAGPTQQMLERMGEGTGRIVMAASRSDEESLESADLGHGYFTYYLLEALKADGGGRPLTQIFASVADKVAERAAATGASQHPVLYRSSPDADFALRTAAPVSAGVPAHTTSAR